MSAHQSRRSRQLPLALLISGLAFVVTLVPAAMYGLPASAAAAGSTLSQCTNGAAGPPTVLEQCAGSGNGTASILNGAVSPSGYANWVNGNANGSKAHWREGEFIPYRLAITGNAPGTYTAQLQYDTVHSGGHAIDYLGSYDASETTSTACPQTSAHTFGPGCPVNPFHANYSNPCADLGMPSSDCNNSSVNPAPAPAPASSVAIPKTCPSGTSNATCTTSNLTAISQGATCGTSGSTGAVAHGTFTQAPGTFDLFGPSGSTINSVTYVSQNVLSGTNTCTTTLNVTFTIGGTTGTPTAVLAWGGHIASGGDWGTGNSASSISGSPYHMVLAACNCGGGKQDRALATSAVVFTTDTSTQLSASSISVGGTASDTATVTGASSGAAGNVTFTVYTNNTCTTQATTGSGGQISAQPGQVPATNNGSGTLTAISPTVTFNQAGTYYWQAAYSGDTTAANTQPSTSPCTATSNEQLVVSSPNLTLTKIADAPSVLAGNQIGFTVTLSNTGQGSANGIILTDNLPSGSGLNWSLDTTNSTIPTGISCTVAGSPPSQSLTCGATPSTNSSFSLAGGATLTLDVISQTTAASCSATAYTNTASFTSTNAGSGSQTASVTVTCPNVTGTKAADAPTVNAGGTIGFVVTLSNTGTGAATNEALNDTLPTGYTWTLLTGTGSGTSIPSGITCDVHGTSPQVLSCGTSPSDTGTFTLAANTTITLHVTAPVPTGSACAPGTVTNTVSFGGTPPNASASVTVTCPNVTGTKAADAPTVNAGGTIGFVVTLSNTGTGAATNEALNDTLPTGYTWTLLTGTGSGTSIPSGITCDVHSTPQVLSCGTSPSDTGTFTLAANTTISLHVTAPVPTGSACVPGTVTNTATFGGASSNTGGQPNASAAVTVTCPNVTGIKTADASPVNAGGTIGFTVTLSNTGTGAATNEALNDQLPVGYTWTLLTGTGSGTSIPSGITCDVHSTPQVLSCGTSPSDTGTFTLAANTTISLHVTATVPTGSACVPGTVTNTATFGGASSNTGGQPNASAAVTVTCPNVTGTKAADAPTVNAGGTIGFTVTLSNGGSGAATNEQLNDQLPAGYTWTLLTGTGSGTSIPSGITCDVHGTSPQVLSCGTSPSDTGTFTLAANTTITLHVTAPVPTGSACAPGTVTNTVSFGGTPPNASASVTVTCPNVTGTKTADALTVNAGGTIGFTVTLSNTGNGAATNEQLNDQLPVGYTWTLLTGTGSGTSIPSGITCDVHSTPQVLSCGTSPSDTGTFTLAANTTISLHVTATVPTGSACVPGTVTNTATFGGASSNTGGQPNASAAVTVTCPNVTGTKAADAPTVNAGGTIGFVVTLSNTGTGAATNEALNDTLPTGYTWTLLTGTGSGTSIPSGITCDVHSTPQVLSCGTSPSDTGTFTLAANTTISLHVTATVPTGSACVPGTVTNTATFGGASSNTGGQPNASAAVTVTCPNVTGTKTADALTVNAGGTIGFTVTLSNTGTGDATNEALNDTLPTGYTWTLTTNTVTPSGTAISCALSTATPQVLSCGPSPATSGTFTLPAGATVTLHVQATVPTGSGCVPGTVTNTATFGGASSNTGGQPNASASVTVTCPNVTGTKTADAPTVNAGGTIGFTVTLSNTGNGAATNEQLNDTLPTGYTWTLTTNTVTPSGTAISCALSTATPQVLSCGPSPATSGTFTLPAGAAITLHVQATVPTGSGCVPGTVTNTATFGGASSNTGGQPNASAAVTVTCPNVAGTKTADAPTVNAGGTIGFTVTLSNTGTGDATNEALNDTLPTGYTWTLTTNTVTPSGTAISCALSTATPQVLSCGPSPATSGTFTLPAGATVTLHVQATVPTGSGCVPGTVTNTATFGGASSNTGGQPNATATVTVTCPNVTGTKTADAPTVNAGGTIGFTVTLSNTGTGDATNEALNDTLPTGYTWTLTTNTVTPSGTAISCALSTATPQVLSCGPSPATSGTFTLPAGAAITLHVQATVPTGSACVPGTVTNTASFGGASSNTGGQPNAMATVTVTCPNVTGNKTPDANGGTVNAATTIGFIVTLSNTGTGAATNETLSDTLPGGGLTWTLLTGSGSGTSIPSGITCDVHGPSPQVLSCGLSPSDTGTFTLTANTTITLHITSPTSGSTCGTFTNIATFGSSTSNAGSGSTPPATITVNCAVLHVTKTACPQSSVVPGGILTYSISFSNSGLGPANNAVLVDTLPAGVQVTSAGGGTVSGNTITWNLGTIASNGSGSESIQVLVTAANGATLVNSVSLTSSSAATAATDQTTTAVSNAGAITHGEANWLNATALGLPLLDAGQVNSMATPSAPQGVAGTQIGPLNLLGLISATLVSDQSNSLVTDQATSTATSTIASVNLLEGAITADAVQAVSQSVATPTTASFNSTGSNFVNLSYLGANGKRINLANVAPNTTVTVYNPLPLLGTQKLAKVVLYQQTGTSGLTNNLWSASGSVNMIDITLLQPFLTLPAGAVIIVGHAQSDASYPSGLACGTAANTVSGEAFSALNNDTLLSNPLLGVLVGDAKLPPTGGSNSNQLAGVTLPDVVLNGTLVNTTSGATTPSPNATSSSTTQAVNLLGGLVTADALDVSSTSQATGTSASTTFGSACTANTCPTGCSTSAPCFVNLAVNGHTLVGINGGTITPNTTIAVPSNGGLILIILNEQIMSGDGTHNTSGTVNAIHVYVLNSSGLLSAEVIVASAHSDAHHG